MTLQKKKEGTYRSFVGRGRTSYLEADPERNKIGIRFNKKNSEMASTIGCVIVCQSESGVVFT